MRIPLAKAHIPKQVFENITQVLNSGKLSGDGFFCHSTEEKLKKILKKILKRNRKQKNSFFVREYRKLKYKYEFIQL